MKTLRMIGMALFAVLMCVNFASCSNDDIAENQETEKIKVSLGCVGEILDISHKPLSRAEAPNLYRIYIYEDGVQYATGSFSSKENISVDLNTKKEYDIKIVYCHSTDIPWEDFKYAYNSDPTILVPSGYPKDIDIYYGVTTDYTPVKDGNVDIFMKRMVFGLNMEAVGLPEGASLTIQLDSDNRNPIILTSEASTFESIYSFYTEYGVKACTGDPYIGVYENEGEEPVDYYTNLSLSIILKRADQRLVNLGSHLIKVQRKKITNVTINVGNSANLTSNGLTIDTEEGGDLENGNSYDYDVDEGEFEDKTLNPQS